MFLSRPALRILAVLATSSMFAASVASFVGFLTSREFGAGCLASSAGCLVIAAVVMRRALGHESAAKLSADEQACARSMEIVRLFRRSCWQLSRWGGFVLVVPFLPADARLDVEPLTRIVAMFAVADIVFIGMISVFDRETLSLAKLAGNKY
jgi:hypothetical protein